SIFAGADGKRLKTELEEESLRYTVAVENNCRIIERTFAGFCTPTQQEETKPQRAMLGLRKLLATFKCNSIFQAPYEAAIKGLEKREPGKKAANVAFALARGEGSPDRFCSPGAPNTNMGWNNVKSTYLPAKKAYLPARRTLARDSLVSEFRAHNTTW